MAGYTVHCMNNGNREEALTLELLQAIDQRSDMSQRRLAHRLGVALGLANSYLRRCVRKGLVKVSQAPANRYLYYLTPKGFAEKSRLTGIYLRNSFNFYRVASASVQEILDSCARQGVQAIALGGVSELAEITLLHSREYPLRVIGVYDPGCEQTEFMGVPVWKELEVMKAATDAAILTCIDTPEAIYGQLCDGLGPARVWVPDILGINGVAK